MEAETAPLEGLRVIEFTHMVMGPSIGVILADLGTEVIKIEPIGDQTRKLLGSGAGYFPMINRRKKSICLDLKSESGIKIARELIDTADILIENFRLGAMEKLGLSYESLRKSNPRLIYCSAKGFLSGPYERRTALDEVTQMMGGLAYMTGPSGRPLRAGSSVVDITGGMFGVIGILAALEKRHHTGVGGTVKCSLYETTAFLVGQHMAQMAVTGKAAAPMPERISAWAIYDVFETAEENEQLFVGVVSDAQWVSFCKAFDLSDFLNNPDYALNNQRVQARDKILPEIRTLFKGMKREELIERLEATGLPFAPIARPHDLFDDPHLNVGGLVDIDMPNGAQTKLPNLPLELNDDRSPQHGDVPSVGADTHEILNNIGMSANHIETLQKEGVIG